MASSYGHLKVVQELLGFRADNGIQNNVRMRRGRGGEGLATQGPRCCNGVEYIVGRENNCNTNKNVDVHTAV